jgi:hypothetical protein
MLPLSESSQAVRYCLRRRVRNCFRKNATGNTCMLELPPEGLRQPHSHKEGVRHDERMPDFQALQNA